MSSVHSKLRKILCCLLSLTLVFVAIPATQIFVQADTISQIKQQIKEYEKKQQQIENKIDKKIVRKYSKALWLRVFCILYFDFFFSLII